MKTRFLVPEPKNLLYYGPRYSRIEVSEGNYKIIHEKYPRHCMARWGLEKCYYFVSPEVFDFFLKLGYDFKALENTKFLAFNGSYIGADKINEYYEDLKDEKLNEYYKNLKFKI